MAPALVFGTHFPRMTAQLNPIKVGSDNILGLTTQPTPPHPTHEAKEKEQQIVENKTSSITKRTYKIWLESNKGGNFMIHLLF